MEIHAQRCHDMAVCVLQHMAAQEWRHIRSVDKESGIQIRTSDERLLIGRLIMEKSNAKSGFTHLFFKPAQKDEYKWIDPMLEAKQKWLRDQERFYRITDYRG